MTTLRPAREADVPSLVELARHSWLSAFAATATAAFVRDRFARDFEQDWYPRYLPDMTVAEDGGVLLGMVQPMGDEVNGVWVDPAAQGRGVGTAMLRHAERQMAAAGHGRAWLTCSGFNPGAVRFYLARGYREVSRGTKDWGGGVMEELLTFERRLSRRSRLNHWLPLTRPATLVLGPCSSPSLARQLGTCSRGTDPCRGVLR